MRTGYYFAIAAAALTLAACAQKAELPEPEGIQMTLHAWHEGHGETKTALQGGGTQVYWEPADEIKVFYRGASGRFVSQNTELAPTADFSGTINVLVGANEDSDPERNIIGLYPYNSAAACEGGTVTTTLPSQQTGRAGSFARNTHIVLASSNSLGLAFYNVTGGLRFSLTQEGIKSVTFEGNNGEALAGTIKLAFTDGIPVVQEVTHGKSVVTLTAPDGGTFQTGQWYYIETIPTTLSSGFKMKFSKDGESEELSYAGSVNIRRGWYSSLANVDEGLVFGPAIPSPAEAVDLGLPSGLKWASCNVGADSPEDYGDYFAWGETEPKTDYSWSMYKFEMGTDWQGPFSKYVTDSLYGTPDNKTVLDSADDAASVNWGGSWRMATYDEWNELMTKCTWTWTTLNGKNGRLVTGPNGNSIFLPAAGFRGDTYLCSAGSLGNYWSSSLSTGGPYGAYDVDFGSDNVFWDGYYRYIGRSVRPITE